MTPKRRFFFVPGLIEQAKRLRLDDEHLVIASSLLCGLIAALEEQEARIKDIQKVKDELVESALDVWRETGEWDERIFGLRPDTPTEKCGE